MTNGKIKSAESLRGLACLAVVFSHVFLVFFPSFYGQDINKETFDVAYIIFNSPFSFFYSGMGAVFVFFVLSGYILTLSSYKSDSSLKNLRGSIVKRIPRLVIPALSSCILMWILVKIPVNLKNTSEWFSVFPIFNVDNGSILDVLYSGTIGTFIFGSTKYNEVLWTMRIELLGSLLIFTLCFLKEKIYKVIVSSIFIIASLLLKPEASILGILAFLIGHLIYFVNFRLSKNSFYIMIITGLYLIGSKKNSISYAFFFEGFGDNKGKFNALLVFLGSIIIVFSILRNNLNNPFLDKKSLVYLGKLSFSIYLVHFPIIYIIGVPSLNFLLSMGVSYSLSGSISIIFTILFSIFIAKSFFVYIDSASIKLSKEINSLFKKR